MNMDEFKDQFITEAKEKLEEAERYIAQLKDGYDPDALTNLKRSFHTLKGNSAAMGYQKYFELSKGCNDLVQKAIDNEIQLDSNVMLLFKNGKDKLLYALDYIENNNPEDFEDEGLIDKLQKY